MSWSRQTDTNADFYFIKTNMAGIHQMRQNANGQAITKQSWMRQNWCRKREAGYEQNTNPDRQIITQWLHHRHNAGGRPHKLVGSLGYLKSSMVSLRFMVSLETRWLWVGTGDWLENNDVAVMSLRIRQVLACNFRRHMHTHGKQASAENSVLRKQI